MRRSWPSRRSTRTAACSAARWRRSSRTAIPTPTTFAEKPRSSSQEEKRRPDLRLLDLGQPARRSSRSSRSTTTCSSTRCSTRASSRRRTSSTPARPRTSRSSPPSWTSTILGHERCSWSAPTTSSRARRTPSSATRRRRSAARSSARSTCRSAARDVGRRGREDRGGQARRHLQHDQRRHERRPSSRPAQGGRHHVGRRSRPSRSASPRRSAPAMARGRHRRLRRLELLPGASDTPKNTAFWPVPRASTGHRVTTDPMEAAYFGVHLWAQAVEAASSAEVAAIRWRSGSRASTRSGRHGHIDPENHHTWKDRSNRPDPKGRPVRHRLAVGASRPSCVSRLWTKAQWELFLTEPLHALGEPWRIRPTSRRGEPANGVAHVGLALVLHHFAVVGWFLLLALCRSGCSPFWRLPLRPVARGGRADPHGGARRAEGRHVENTYCRNQHDATFVASGRLSVFDADLGPRLCFGSWLREYANAVRADALSDPGPGRRHRPLPHRRLLPSRRPRISWSSLRTGPRGSELAQLDDARTLADGDLALRSPSGDKLDRRLHRADLEGGSAIGVGCR